LSGLEAGGDIEIEIKVFKTQKTQNRILYIGFREACEAPSNAS
jgi:hypothetical protein